MAAGYKDFTAGAVLTAADLEDYCQNQSSMRFTNTTSRDTALSTVKTNGMHAVDLTNKVEAVYDGAAWQQVAAWGGVVTYTPTFGNITTAAATAYYILANRVCTFWCYLTGGTVTAGGNITVTAPFTNGVALRIMLAAGNVNTPSFYAAYIASASSTVTISKSATGTTWTGGDAVANTMVTGSFPI